MLERSDVVIDHYLDVHLRSDPEFPVHQVMDALYKKLHRALVQMQANTIGVSFPGYSETRITLGDTFRLIGPRTDLTRLMEQPWLMGLRDHTILSDIAPVPNITEHCSLRRVQAKSNPERLMRRHMRRHEVSEAQARAKYFNAEPETLRLPFVTLTSASTGQSFKLFLKLNATESYCQEGGFNAYGLSPTATLPWF